jgi:hypothetical protein
MKNNHRGDDGELADPASLRSARVDCELSPEDQVPEGRQRPGRLQDPRQPQETQKRQEHRQGVKPVLAQVAAFGGRERELRRELDEEQPPECPAQGRELPRHGPLTSPVSSTIASSTSAREAKASGTSR